jgi:hypothetical protein
MSTSAFGVDHGLVSKGRKAGGLHPGSDSYPSMQHRGGAGYTQPSAEQLAASKVRRSAQKERAIAHKKAKQTTPRGGGRKIPLKAHWKSAGGLRNTTAAAALLGGGTLYGMHKIEKADRKRQAAYGTAGAASGTALSYASSNIGGQAAKATLKSRRAKRGVSPAEERIWTKHKAAHPVNSGKTLVDRYAKYPKELPDWRFQRALAIKNRSTATGAGLALGGAAGAAHGVSVARRKGAS